MNQKNNYTNELRFVDSLPSIKGRGRKKRTGLDFVVHTLAQRPDEWAVVRIYKYSKSEEKRTRNSAYQYSHQLRTQYRHKGLQSVTRKVGDTHVVYARINSDNTNK